MVLEQRSRWVVYHLQFVNRATWSAALGIIVFQMGSRAQALKPEMIDVGNHHAAMKNNAHEAISKRYVAQDSSVLILSLDRLNSAA
jgi:hypothetical protein